VTNIRTGTVRTGDVVVDEVIKKTAAATQSTDPIEIAQAQLELSRVMVTLLQQIDWKLWELYSKYAKQ